MHILVVNDDGPPSNQSSPYIHSLVDTLQSSGHTVSVILPHRQRSWIGKAHLVGATVKPTYFRPGTLHRDDGTIHHLPGNDSGEGGDEWVLIDSTPASCVQIGLYHYFQDRGPVDLVMSGPNYGRNVTALFSLSSGTIGGAMEAAVCSVRAIALSYAFSSRNHDPVVIAEASRLATRLTEYLCKNWDADVDVYSVNIPLEPGIEEKRIMYTNMLSNRWTSGSCFEAIDAETSGEGPDLQEQHLRQEGELKAAEGNGQSRASTPRYHHRHFKWAPKFSDVYKSIHESSSGNDGWALKEGMTSVTPLKANFMQVQNYTDEIKFPFKQPRLYALVDCEDAYVQPLVVRALQNRLPETSFEMISAISQLPDPSSPVLQYRVYEKHDFEHLLDHPYTSLANSYIIRKALTRKHYLSSTIANWVTKHPDSILRQHFKPAVEFELDYAEFLDEALLEAYELRESFERNEDKGEGEKEWWILKPGMSDRGHGIRLFNSELSLQGIFEEWEANGDESASEEGSEDEDNINEPDDVQDGENKAGSGMGDGVVTSQLRHFIAQPYIHPPLLLPSMSNRKFHVRAYVLAVGSLKVYVCREMLALFAEKPYIDPCDKDGIADLSRHLTNTCLQTGGERTSGSDNSVRRFRSLDRTVPPLRSNWKEDVYEQICLVCGEVFEAAAREMLVHFQTLPNAFEVFGVDFLVDGSGRAWLLELNAFPDFRQTGEELRDAVVGKLFEGIVDVAVKPFFGIPTKVEGDDAAAGQTQFGLHLVTDLDLGKK